MRKLVSIRKISNIQPIVGADKIEEVVVDGWSVVAAKGIHSVGDDIVFFEIDCFLPESDIRYKSFMKFGTRQYRGVIGHRIKTKKLRGIYSQGVILPLSEFPEIVEISYDVDYSELLGIVKWDIEAANFSSRGMPSGSFPYFIRKTDQERIQNLYNKYSNDPSIKDRLFAPTLKLNGSSITAYYIEGEKYTRDVSIPFEYGLCSRNFQLKFEGEDGEKDNAFVIGATNSGLFEKCKQLHDIFGGYYAIQGELVGPKVQGNYEGILELKVYAFDIFDIDKQEYVDYDTFKIMAEAVNLLCVPMLGSPVDILNFTLKDILAISDGPSINNTTRKGIVWKTIDSPYLSFKAISNVFLEHEE